MKTHVPLVMRFYDEVAQRRRGHSRTKPASRSSRKYDDARALGDVPSMSFAAQVKQRPGWQIAGSRIPDRAAAFHTNSPRRNRFHGGRPACGEPHGKTARYGL